MSTIDDSSRVCRVCRQSKPIGQFRLRHRGQAARHRECRACATAAQRARRFRARLRVLDRFNTQILAAKSLNAISALCAAVFRRLGGAEAFAGLWVEAIKARRGQRRGGRAALASFLALFKMVETVHRNRQRPDWDALDDATLQRAIDRYVERHAVGMGDG